MSKPPATTVAWVAVALTFLLNAGGWVWHGGKTVAGQDDILRRLTAIEIRLDRVALLRQSSDSVLLLNMSRNDLRINENSDRIAQMERTVGDILVELRRQRVPN